MRCYFGTQGVGHWSFGNFEEGNWRGSFGRTEAIYELGFIVLCSSRRIEFIATIELAHATQLNLTAAIHYWTCVFLTMALSET